MKKTTQIMPGFPGSVLFVKGQIKSAYSGKEQIEISVVFNEEELHTLKNAIGFYLKKNDTTCSSFNALAALYVKIDKHDVLIHKTAEREADKYEALNKRR